MCDSFVALPSATTTGTTLAAKNADCEINEAQAVLRLPRGRYPAGAMLRASHLVIPQARETHEIIIDKSFWTWGGEIGLNEHGVAVGNEAIWPHHRRTAAPEGRVRDISACGQWPTCCGSIPRDTIRPRATSARISACTQARIPTDSGRLAAL